MLVIERMLPEYAAVALKNPINKITKQLYFEKLKKNASKNFFKWVKNQIDPKREGDNVFKQMVKLSQKIFQVDAELRKQNFLA